MEKFMLSEVELKRYKILSDALLDKLTFKEASLALGLSYRQTLRLKEKLKTLGPAGLQRIKPKKPPNLKITPELRKTIISLRQEHYFDFNVLHFRDKLIEEHNISLSYESLRRLLIEEGLHEPRRKRKVYRRRRRMPKAGMLVQMDSSLHRWIEDIPESWWLVAMKDDSDGYVGGKFFPADTTLANMEVLKDYIKRRGLFETLYVDKASHFKTTRHGGLHYEVSVEQEDTQIQRALKELNINIVYANSPQAKGRIERLFGFLQDRLIKELRLRKIKDYETANRFLEEEFWPWYNNRYLLQIESVYRELPERLNLDLVFSLKQVRKVNRDNTIRYKGRVYQLLGGSGYSTLSGKEVEVCEQVDGKIRILYRGTEVRFEEIMDKRKGLDDEEILSKRQNMKEFRVVKERWRPSPHHPWRKILKLKKRIAP